MPLHAQPDRQAGEAWAPGSAAEHGPGASLHLILCVCFPLKTSQVKMEGQGRCWVRPGPPRRSLQLHNPYVVLGSLSVLCVS